MQIVMTKCDLVKEEDLARRHTLVLEELQHYSKALKTIRMISAYTGELCPSLSLSLSLSIYLYICLFLSHKPVPHSSRQCPSVPSLSLSLSLSLSNTHTLYTQATALKPVPHS
jgi:hypothetical protein